MAKKPIFVRIGPGVGLGYRRNQTAGSWVGRFADGKGANRTEVIGLADDYENANGSRTLDFLAGTGPGACACSGRRRPDLGATIRVGEALEAYEADLRTRGGDVGNVARVRLHLAPELRGMSVALLVAGDLRRWRDGLTKTLAPSTVNRTCTALKAALNLAADHDERIANRRAWVTGLGTIRDAEESRNVILGDANIRWIIAEARTLSPGFGVFVEVAAVTGARVSQLSRLEVQDRQAESRRSPAANADFAKRQGHKKDPAASGAYPRGARGELTGHGNRSSGHGPPAPQAER